MSCIQRKQSREREVRIGNVQKCREATATFTPQHPPLRLRYVNTASGRGAANKSCKSIGKNAHKEHLKSRKNTRTNRRPSSKSPLCLQDSSLKTIISRGCHHFPALFQTFSHPHTHTHTPATPDISLSSHMRLHNWCRGCSHLRV